MGRMMAPESDRSLLWRRIKYVGVRLMLAAVALVLVLLLIPSRDFLPRIMWGSWAARPKVVTVDDETRLTIPYEAEREDVESLLRGLGHFDPLHSVRSLDWGNLRVDLGRERPDPAGFASVVSAVGPELWGTATWGTEPALVVACPQAKPCGGDALRILQAADKHPDAFKTVEIGGDEEATRVRLSTDAPLGALPETLTEVGESLQDFVIDSDVGENHWRRSTSRHGPKPQSPTLMRVDISDADLGAVRQQIIVQLEGFDLSDLEVVNTDANFMILGDCDATEALKLERNPAFLGARCDQSEVFIETHDFVALRPALDLLPTDATVYLPQLNDLRALRTPMLEATPPLVGRAAAILDATTNPLSSLAADPAGALHVGWRLQPSDSCGDGFDCAAIVRAILENRQRVQIELSIEGMDASDQVHWSPQHGASFTKMESPVARQLHQLLKRGS